MSLPTFPPIEPPLSREGSINEIISSIAAEELSLSHILNAEGEKLQYVLGTLPGLETAAALDEVMQVNQSVQETLSSVMEQQMMLTGKLASAPPLPPGPGGRGAGGGGPPGGGASAPSPPAGGGGGAGRGGGRRRSQRDDRSPSGGGVPWSPRRNPGGRGGLFMHNIRFSFCGE